MAAQIGIAMNDVLTPGKFSIDDLTPYWDGFDDPGKRWNGWRMPFFTERVMLSIKAHMESDPGWADGPDQIVIEHHPERHASERFTVVETADKHRSAVLAANTDGVWTWQLGGGSGWVAERDNER